MPTPRRGYYVDGVRVPSVTTVLKAGSFMDGDALCGWAAKLARAGKDWRTERERAGYVGTAVHDAIESLPSQPVRRPDYSDAEWDRIAGAVQSHTEWVARHRPKTVLQEVQLVSRELRVGGTPDLVVKLGDDEDLLLTDHKTGKRLTGKEVAQVSAYAHMLQECVGLPVKGVLIFHHPSDAPFRVVALGPDMLREGLRAFKLCRELYDLVVPLNDAVDVDLSGSTFKEG